MKESYWGYWLLVLGVFVIVVLLLVQSFTSTNTQDYYMVKTITEAAMEDAIDYSYFRTYGEAKINKEKFFESFLRRFSEEASLSTTYHITFSDIYEAPPKVSVKVASKAGGFSVVGDSGDIDIVNKIDAILESSKFTRKVTAYEREVESHDWEVANEIEIDHTTNTELYTKYAEGSGCYFNPASYDTSMPNYCKKNFMVEFVGCGTPTDSLVKRGLSYYTAGNEYCVFRGIPKDKDGNALLETDTVLYYRCQITMKKDEINKYVKCN